ncbi:MAG: AAA family ATPase [Myxococcaceae bacterium]
MASEPCQLSIQNFKGISSLDFRLDSPLTALIGRNGSGKTTLLQSINLVGGLWTKEVPTVPPMNEWILRSVGGSEAASELMTDPKPGQLNIEMTQGSLGARLQIKSGGHCSVSARHGANQVSFHTDTGGGNPIGDVVRHPALELFRSQLLQFDARALARPTPSPTQAPTLGTDGSGLAAVLSYMAQYDRSALLQLENTLKKIVPGVSEIRTQFVPIRGEMTVESNGNVILPPTLAGLRSMVVFGTKEIWANNVSEGTLLTLGILAAALGQTRPNILLIDDIDRGLHPQAQSELITNLRTILVEHPRLRIVCTTHSPYILDHFEDDEVTVTARRPNGQVVVRPLSEHPDFAAFRDKLRAGEFWSSVGEDWVQ